MTEKFKTLSLDGAAIDVLGQLFIKGPVWDGNLSSKSGRSILVGIGLAQQRNGWTFLTEEGVRVATEWDRDLLKRRHDQRWYEKAVLCR